jgi:hypothetical protein
MPKHSKQPKYTTSDGAVLALFETRHAFAIGWYYPQAEEGSDPSDAPLGDFKTYDQEFTTAQEAVRAYAIDPKEHIFEFDSKKRAQQALDAANVALLGVERPWPDWAVKAKDAGWTPPDGWKP